MSQLYVFSGNLFSKKSQIGMQITSLEGRGTKKPSRGGLLKLIEIYYSLGGWKHAAGEQFNP